MLVGLGVAAVLIVGVVALFVWGANPPEEVSVEEAQERFQPSTTEEPESDVTTTTGVQPFDLPPQGVFLARGEGTEDTSFPPVVEQQGPDMPVTVTWTGDDCYQYRIDYNTNHWQQWQLCLTDLGLDEHGGTTFQRRDYGALKVDSTATFVCEPPSPILQWDTIAGDQLEASCDGTNDVIAGDTNSAGTNTFLGIEPVEVGDDEVEAYHVRGERDVTGAQEGHESWDMWLATETGMPLRRTHTIEVQTDTPFGDIDYREETDWTLTSLDPQS